MDMTTLLQNTLWYLTGFLLWPIKLLGYIGAWLLPCSEYGIETLSDTVVTNMGNWILFFFPVVKYLPWDFIWNFFWAIVVWQLFIFLWRQFPTINDFLHHWWPVILALWLLGGIITTFIGDEWRDSSVFDEIFNGAPTSTGFSGGGGGGGGGGSW